MNNPNPLAPKSSLEQNAKPKTSLPVIVFVFLAFHAVVLGGFLMAGCKPDTAKQEAKNNATPPPDLTPLPQPPTNNADYLQPLTSPSGTAPMTNVAPPVSAPPTPSPVSVAPVAPVTPVTPVAPPAAPVTPVVAPPVASPVPMAPVTPVGTEPVVPAVTGEAKTHVIAKGDLLVTVAKKYGVTVAAIEKANPGVDPKKLKVGQKIAIPAKTEATKSVKKEEAIDGGGPKSANEYTVKSGDNLGNIAKAHHTTVKAIKELNGLQTDGIKVGQKLKLPPPSAPAAKKTAAVATPATPSADAAAAAPVK